MHSESTNTHETPNLQTIRKTNYNMGQVRFPLRHAHLPQSRTRIYPPGVPRGYRGSGPVISGVLRAGAGVILVRHISRGHSTGPDAAGDVTFAPKSGHWVQNHALSGPVTSENPRATLLLSDGASCLSAASYVRLTPSCVVTLCDLS